MKKGTAYIMFGSVEEYISSFPVPVQQVLKDVQKSVMSAAPKGIETMSYGLPTVKLGGKVVVHYGAFQKHIGLYATPTGHAAFAAKLAPYKQGKGSVQFSLSAPMPLALIAEIVKFRARSLVQAESEKRRTVPASKSSGS